MLQKTLNQTASTLYLHQILAVVARIVMIKKPVSNLCLFLYPSWQQFLVELHTGDMAALWRSV